MRGREAPGPGKTAMRRKRTTADAEARKKKAAAARTQGLKVGHVHLRWLNPLPANLADVCAQYDHKLVAELNLGSPHSSVPWPIVHCGEHQGRGGIIWR